MTGFNLKKSTSKKERLKNLKNLYKGTIVQGYRVYIEMALNAIITSPTQLRNSWDELMEQVEKAVNFGDWFIKLDGYDQQENWIEMFWNFFREQRIFKSQS